MADERDRWLDGAAADRLLRGEPVEPVGPAAAPRAREDAARLRAALDALAAPPAADRELPGEAAALAAFRAARGGAAHGVPVRGGAGDDGTRHNGPGPTGDCAGGRAGAAAVGDPGSPGGSGGPGEPLVNLGPVDHTPLPAPRRGRPLRLGLAAALAGVAVGGLAAAAGAGLLDQPRRTGAQPAHSVSAGATPASVAGTDGVEPVPPAEPRLLSSRDPAGTAAPGTATDGAEHPPGATEGHPEPGSGTTPGGTTDGATDQDGEDRREDDGAGSRREHSNGTTKDRERERENRSRAVDLCRDHRAGHLDAAGRDRLSRMARGASRVRDYCEALLAGGAHGGRGGSSGRSDGGSHGSGTGVLQIPPAVPEHQHDHRQHQDRQDDSSSRHGRR
ncbi:hypothetical protein [Streptomyces sp. NPDC051567]|uniref:hypothetical protein n=1 Tax=Streptomyces sp. NPDC051567 TaxID=3365660 RepID=UPI00379447D2